MPVEFAVIIASFIVAGLATTFALRKKAASVEQTRFRAQQILQKAQEEVAQLREDTEEKMKNTKRTNIESEKTFKEFLSKIEESIKMKEESYLRKEQRIKELDESHKEEQLKNAVLSKRNEELVFQMKTALSSRAGVAVETMQKDMLENLARELKEENELRYKLLEEFYKENAESEAKNLILNVLQRLSSPTSNEKRYLQVHVPADPLKAKVVGKNAENIKKLEEILEVDVIFNDFPNTITISHYNLLIRHIAKKTIEKIFAEKGVVTPEVVERKVEEARKDTDRELMAIGREAMKRMNIKRKIPDEMLQIIGRLQYRTSYGQNIMRHSFEVGLLALMMGYELGLDVETCKIGGFLHDLGKAIDQNPDVIGAHDYLTKELMEKYEFPEDEVHAAWTHHDSAPPKTPEAFVIKGADAISAGRPGARQESLDKYIDRIHQLEDIANSYEGVSKIQIMSAGRDMRVYVDPHEITDDLLLPLAENIAGEIKENVAYPGYVRVNTIRRTQVSETARPKAPSA